MPVKKAEYDLISPNNDKILNRAGFYPTDGEGFRIYMVLTETYKNELCKGFDQRTLTRVLLQADWLKPAPDGKASHKPRIKGVGTPRLFVFTGNLLPLECLHCVCTTFSNFLKLHVTT